MASLLSFRPSLLRPPPSSASRRNSDRSESLRLRAASSASNWWTPIFGWGSDPDYFHGHDAAQSSSSAAEKPRAETDKDAAGTEPRRRYAPGCFTEEKAKQLRLKTVQSETFHDVMYHSAIASRLASDLSDRFGR